MGRKGGEHRPRRQPLFQFDGLGVGAELRTLVDVQDLYRDGCRGLAGQMDVSGQRDLILCLHCQHEGVVQLKVYGLDQKSRKRTKVNRSL